MPAPIDPSFAVSGAEWSVGGVSPVSPADGAASGSSGGSTFAGALGKALESVQGSQEAADTAVQGMVTGNADPTEAVMARERARLSMQLAGQVRTKAIEAFQDVFHTQV
jgi:flagellar hook-basal body complex protein FliE